MDKILNFVALRPPAQDVSSPPALTDSTEFQRELAAAAGSASPLETALAAAQAFVESGRFVSTADQVQQGNALVDLVDLLNDGAERTMSEIRGEVRTAVGDFGPGDWAEDAAQVRDSVLAGYLLEGAGGPSAATALKLARAYGLVATATARSVSQAQIDALLRAPLVLPESLLGLRARPETADAPTAPEETANALLEEFKSTLAEHARLSETLAQIASHDEDELLLSELGVQRPLATAFQARPEREEEQQPDREREDRLRAAVVSDVGGSSPLRRAAARSNVIFSETAVALLSEPARDTLHSLGLDPSSATVRDMESQVRAAHVRATRTLQTMGNNLGTMKAERNLEFEAEILGSWAGAIAYWATDPVNDPAPVEPVAKTPPQTFTTVRELGIADLFVVRAHLSRYERGEVASLENILSDEKLTHTTRQVSEVETTDTADSEQTSLQSLAQTTADQDAGKTTAQSLGAGRGPLTSDGPQLLPVGHGPGIFQLVGARAQVICGAPAAAHGRRVRACL